MNGPTPIPDSQITASSSWRLDHGPKYARLNNTAGAGAWCPGAIEVDAPTPNMYIQVGIKESGRICRALARGFASVVKPSAD